MKAKIETWVMGNTGTVAGLIVLPYVIVQIVDQHRLWGSKRHTVNLIFLAVYALMLLWIISAAWTSYQRKRRETYLKTAPLANFLKHKLRQQYPHLSGADCDLVEQGLRDFFLACLTMRKQFVAMPSLVVDAMWHEFILHTQAYQSWCKQGLGRFLHHTPAEALCKNPIRNDGLRRAWHWACKNENINPRTPAHLPLLFALDTRLAIADGFRYEPDCAAGMRQVKQDQNGTGGGCGGQCATDFSSDRYSGGNADFGGAESSSSVDGGGGDGGGDGGGCGGGCGGD